MNYNRAYIVHLKYMFSQTHPFFSEYEWIILTIKVYGTKNWNNVQFLFWHMYWGYVRERHYSEEIYTEVFTGKGAWCLQVTLK